MHDFLEALRAKRQGNVGTSSNNNNVGLGFNNGFAIPGLGNVLQQKAKIPGASDQFGTGASANIDTQNPNLSFQKGFNGFGVVNGQSGVDRIGDRGNGNFGAGFGQNLGFLGNTFGLGDNTDLNYNKNQGFTAQNERGLKGIFTQSGGFNINPQAGGGVGFGKKTCILGNLCFNQGAGLNLG
uniref:Uncharacterized protein n=1 Tax=Romanomermis culicivorax TaxID=13658 RepID=A0A915JMB7_ROMCU